MIQEIQRRKCFRKFFEERVQSLVENVNHIRQQEVSIRDEYVLFVFQIFKFKILYIYIYVKL